MYGVDFVFWDFGFVPVESACPVRTGGFAITATDAPIVIDNGDAIGFFPGGTYGAYVDARWVFALEALGAHVEVAFGGYLVHVFGGAVFEVEFAFLHFEDADVLHVGAAVLVVFLDACIDTIPITFAFGDVEGITI